MNVRPATHAGSWYYNNPAKLNGQLDKFLSNAPDSKPGARVLIGPHAGYSYAGSTLAETYKAWDTSKVKRVFVLGPSHHFYIKNMAMVSDFNYYETPFGNLKVDREVVSSLLSKHKYFYKKMSSGIDEDEHSFEMHAPYIYKLTQGLPQGHPTIIPIMIGSTDSAFERSLSETLLPYFEDEENTFVISSDFCHWGSRFDYTEYAKSKDSLSELITLDYYSPIPKGSIPIYQSIEYLDKEAMAVASMGSYLKWKKYISRTGNTICGQKPIGILLHIMEKYLDSNGVDDEEQGNYGKFQWLGYTQSNAVTSPQESSVSYASGYVCI